MPTSAATGVAETGASVDQVTPGIFRSAIGFHQPMLWPSMSAKISAPKPSMLRSRPTTSSPGTAISALVSSTTSRAPRTTRMPIGTFTRKIHRHEKSVVSQPPRSGPTAAMPAMTEPQIANAITRSLPRKVAFTVDSVHGSTAAPPMPWMRRAQISDIESSAAAARRLPARNTATPTMNSSRRPIRSLSLPADSSSAAKTTE